MGLPDQLPSQPEAASDPDQVPLSVDGLLHGMRARMDATHAEEAGSTPKSLDSDPALAAAPQGETLQAQARHLRERADRTQINVFTSTGLRIGAQRLDARREAEGLQPIHEPTYDRQLRRSSGGERFDAGYKEVITPGTPLLLPVVQTAVGLVAEHVDWRLNNPALACNVAGTSRRHPRTGNRPVFITPSMNGVMQTEKWPDELKALALAVGMHHLAMRNARRLVTPFLVDDEHMSQIQNGAESRFWSAKLFGSGDNEGLFYYLGYAEKSRARLRAFMQELWGDDYERNRQAFLSTLLLRTAVITGPKRKEGIRAIRRPLYRAVAEGDFASADEQLRALASEHPRMFSSIGLEYFRGENSRNPLGAIALDDEQVAID